ncbi:MAG TPA: class I SAM-dependent methyltransferase, partial [Anaerolineae bacterium]|nr:class I SAM-dependent methyltransferase [Anaerolineae bacterium]
MSNEATYHDALVGHSRRSIGGGLTQTADAYALSLLGDVRGCTVIDLGCGRGSNSVLLAQRGAYVIACDISP